MGRLKIAGWVKRRQGCIRVEEGRGKGQWSGEGNSMWLSQLRGGRFWPVKGHGPWGRSR